MTHKPILIQDIALIFSHKICFSAFTTTLSHGQRIGIIGRNGSGKSMLLKMLSRHIEPSEGVIKIPEDVCIGYIPQVIETFDNYSGGERLNRELTEALVVDPNLLLLDEPTNHLDVDHRKSLIRLLKRFDGTLIIVSHDVDLLDQVVDVLWHIDHGNIHEFVGSYADYMREIHVQRKHIEEELAFLDKRKKDIHDSLMKEQERAKKSRGQGEKNIKQRKWPTIVSGAKARRGEETSGRKKSSLREKNQELSEKLSGLYLPEIIIPIFSLTSADMGERVIVSINEGSVGYENPFLENLNLSLASRDRIAICGNNGSGKSTLIKAILSDPKVIKSGTWHIPKPENVGYLDQFYHTLDLHKTVLETILDLRPAWPHEEVRKHLNDFLFRKNEEVNAHVSTLSGGEKARLSLAQIAAKTPKLLILDEMTNNLDLETRDHIIQVLKMYPAAMILISHDENFLKQVNVDQFYQIKEGTLVLEG